ncbi:hypothetical protein 0305phi8-36p094 [Bacillus phage 0305phi8-36]|uniref:hypothetical protein n=1 Tax=Bacillus phage 0305phi8-36 TaxID=458639 RepID=UPI00015A1FBD|nr:hypothetical protein ST0305phi8-36p094 [Bacillus phage 0305phi8-36]ABS83654.1 hypothetical protein 0305phi8-36p094 [Bacillus phage 0305phi8-36]
MNIKFNVEGIKVNVPTQEATIEIGKLEYSIEGLNIMDSLKVAQALPTIVRDLRKAIEEPMWENDAQRDIEAEAYSDMVQRDAEERASKSYAGADNDGDKITSIVDNNINPELHYESESEMESPESHS